MNSFFFFYCFARLMSRRDISLEARSKEGKNMAQIKDLFVCFWLKYPFFMLRLLLSPLCYYSFILVSSSSVLYSSVCLLHWFDRNVCVCVCVFCLYRKNRTFNEYVYAMCSKVNVSEWIYYTGWFTSYVLYWLFWIQCWSYHELCICHISTLLSFRVFPKSDLPLQSYGKTSKK